MPWINFSFVVVWSYATRSDIQVLYLDFSNSATHQLIGISKVSDVYHAPTNLDSALGIHQSLYCANHPYPTFTYISKKYKSQYLGVRST